MFKHKFNSSYSPPREKEQKTIKQLKQFLSSADSLPKLVNSAGEEIVLSESVYDMLYNVLEAMESGVEITISPLNQNITVSEAAATLNTSCSYIEQLLEQGDISYTNCGTVKHINFQELLNYKDKRDITRRKALSEFTSLLQEEGFYS